MQETISCECRTQAPQLFSASQQQYKKIILKNLHMISPTVKLIEKGSTKRALRRINTLNKPLTGFKSWNHHNLTGGKGSFPLYVKPPVLGLSLWCNTNLQHQTCIADIVWYPTFWSDANTILFCHSAIKTSPRSDPEMPSSFLNLYGFWNKASVCLKKVQGKHCSQRRERVGLREEPRKGHSLKTLS